MSNVEHPYFHRRLDYPQAGHDVGSAIPTFPSATRSTSAARHARPRWPRPSCGPRSSTSYTTRGEPAAARSALNQLALGWLERFRSAAAPRRERPTRRSSLLAFLRSAGRAVPAATAAGRVL